MILVEINTPTWRHIAFDENGNSDGLDNFLDLLDDIMETSHIREFTAKQIISRRFNIKVRQKGIHKGYLVVKRVIDPKKKGKLALNWEGPFHICQSLHNGTYKLENLESVEIPRTWNVTSLKFHLS